MALNTSARQVDGYDNPMKVKDDDSLSITISNENEDNGKEPNGKDVENQTENDLNLAFLLDPNTYASKKTLATAILDLALLSANASQLKFVLTVGEEHEFYSLLLTLICISIGLQVLQAVIFIILGMILDINKVDEQKNANITNNISLAIQVVTVVVNVVISAFDMKSISDIV